MTGKLRDGKHDTFPGGALPYDDETGPDPEPAPARPDGYRYERPRIDDSMSLRLLDGLNAERFPRSITLSQTDGQLAAHYQVGPTSVPVAVPTPPPEPSVLLGGTTSVTDVPPPSPSSFQDSTVAMVLPIRRPRWLVVGLAMAAATSLGVVALLLMHKPSSPSSTSSVAASVAAQWLPEPAAGSTSTAPTVAPASLSALPVKVVPTAAQPTSRQPPRASPPKASAPAVRRVAAPVKEADVPPSSKIDREE